MKKRITIELESTDIDYILYYTSTMTPQQVKNEIHSKLQAAWEAGEEVKPKIEWLDWVRTPTGHEGCVISRNQENLVVGFSDDHIHCLDYHDSELTLIRKHERNQP